MSELLKVDAAVTNSCHEHKEIMYSLYKGNIEHLCIN